MEYFVGLDVSLRSVAVCVIDADGQTVFERSVACEIDDISECLADFAACDLRIGFEAGAMSQHLFFGLQAIGFDCQSASNADPPSASNIDPSGAEQARRCVVPI